MKRLLLLLLLLPWRAMAQPVASLDEVRRALAVARTDTARARLYWALSERVESQDSVPIYARRALVILDREPPARLPAERYRLLRLQAAALNNAGYGEPDPRVALAYYERAWALRRQLADWHGQAETSINFGDCYQRAGDYRAAIKWFERGLRVAEVHPAAQEWVSSLLGHLANVYDLQGDPDVALRYYQRALQLDEQHGDTRAIAERLRLISGMLVQLQRYASADSIAQRGLQLAQRSGFQEAVGGFYNLLGTLRMGQNRLGEAYTCLTAARLVFAQLHDDASLGLVWLYLGQVAQKSNRSAEALRAAQRADTLLRGAHQPEALKDVALLLSGLYQQRGDDRRALRYYQQYTQRRDSLRNEQNQRAALQQRIGYEYEKKESALKATQAVAQAVAQAEIRRQKLLRYATTGGAVLLLLLAGALWQRFRFARRANAKIQAAREIAEHERRRSDELLLNILPADTAEELKRTGQARARQYEQVTVLFADVVDFTQLAERLPAQELVAVLDTYFGRFDRLCDEFGLEKIKTIGDAYMLTGGLHGPAAGAPAAVVRCALAMQATAENLQRERESLGLPALLWRVGIHTGPLVAGVVGLRKFAYDIWGDTVNTAARMESCGVARQVNISGATFALVRQRFVCTPRGPIAARHKGHIEMYFVEGPLTEADELRTAPGLIA